MRSSYSTLNEIQDDFKQLTNNEEKENLAVLLLHDVTGIKKKDIKQVLKYGPQLFDIYSKKQDFQVNKKPSAKVTKAKAKKGKK